MDNPTEAQEAAWIRRNQKIQELILSRLTEAKERDTDWFFHAGTHLYRCSKCGNEQFSGLLCPFPDFPCTCIITCPQCYKEGEQK